MVTTLALSLGLGMLAGLLAALWVRSWKDHLISIAAIVAYATPLFWVGLMLILTFSIKLDWFPTSGMEDVVAFHEGFARVLDIAHHLVLPSITLALFYMALYARLMRATMLDQRGLDYVTTARAKGLTERRIAGRHMLRNALLPVLTMAGVQVYSAVPSSSKVYLPGQASASSPSKPCSVGTSISCSASSSCRRAWWSPSTSSSTCFTSCSTHASGSVEVGVG
jgi:ABC-type dipeptide/oligopeptide/nickel transport system permease component